MKNLKALLENSLGRLAHGEQRVDCNRIREAVARGASTREEERHLFSCPHCRARVRMDQAWKNQPRPEAQENQEPVGEAFVGRVLEAVRRDRRRRRRERASLAVAAALLFFFLAGAAGQIASSSASSAEDAYAQMLAPSSLDSLLPD